MLGEKRYRLLSELGTWTERSTARVAGGELKLSKDLLCIPLLCEMKSILISTNCNYKKVGERTKI
jgi:hypothetical protein